jgi:hypothetical protein
MLALCARTAIAQTTDVKPAEQTHFSAEDESVKNPVAIPPAAQTLLMSDESVKEALEAEQPPISGFPAEWFSASIVYLGSRGEKDLVAVAKGRLVGANITEFWVFRQIGGTYRLVLNASAHDLTVMPARWNGFREIELFSATGTAVHTVLLRLEGDSYKPYSDRWESIQ